MMCDYCDGPIVPTATTPGYGQQEGGKRACFACCGWLDIMRMREGKALCLYVDAGGTTISNWPGTLRLSVLGRKTGHHNMTGRRTTHYFRGPDASRWSGVEYHGDASGSLLRQVRRLKGRSS